MRFRRPSACGLALGLALGLASCGQDPLATDTSRGSLASTPGSAAHVAAIAGTITLITGDRVTLRSVGGSQASEVQPGPGRKEVAFSIMEHAGEVTVMPQDVAVLVASGRLDPALFNVSKLLADGYGDDKRSDLPLVVTGQPDVAAFGRQLASTGITVDRLLPALHVVAVRQDKASPGAVIASLTGPGTTGFIGPGAIGRASARATSASKIWLDRRFKPVLDRSVPQVGGLAAHARGLTGAGVTVAVLDSGIDTSHPDLAGKVVAAETFVDDGRDASDVLGHGTHVASIIAGTGAASNGQFRGVAPDAALISGRVCGEDFCLLSAILDGMEWAVVERGARIVNLSLGGQDSPEEDPLEAAINQLSAELGALFVVAAGNNGFGPGSIDSPGSADSALTVGAVDRDDQRATFSGMGPRVGDRAVKPDITAPGVGIVAARAAGARIGQPVGESYLRLDGTSMATPHVAGAAAILLQQHPGWTGAQLKAALIGAASPNAALGAFEQGGGRLDIDRATQQTMLAAPASLSLGFASFPHSDDPLITRTVRYDNAGTEPVTLALGASLTGPGGRPAPAGSIAIAPSAITVPAGGSAEVVVTVDTSREGSDGLYSGALTATGDGVRVVTPLGVEREVESYDLTISVRDRAGDPATVLLTMLRVGASPFPTPAVLNDVLADRATYRLPRGQYVIETLDFVSDLTQLIASRFELARDSELVMDGRLAKPFDVDIVGHDLELTALSSTFTDRLTGFVFLTTADRQIATAEISPGAPPGEVSSELHALLVPPGEIAPTVTYHLARQELDHFVTGWKQTLRPRDLATVHASHAGGKPDEVLKRVGAFAPNSLAFVALGVFFEAPFSLTEHYYGPGFRWSVELDQLFADPEVPELKTIIASSNEIRTFREGRSFDEPWSQAPFGPAFAGPSLFAFRPDLLGAPLRDGDTLFVQPSMFSDQHVPARFVLSALDEQHARLLADGKVIAQLDDVFSSFPPVTVPPGPAQYRFEQAVTRPEALFDLSTRVAAAWTFRSRHVDGEPETLALPTLRFTPALDEHNQTDALALVLPVHIERPAGAGAPRLAQVNVDASFDDGATWSRVPLLVLGDDAFGVVVHPRTATHVSLRGSAADVAGNQVEQMIIHAYGLAPR